MTRKDGRCTGHREYRFHSRGSARDGASHNQYGDRAVDIGKRVYETLLDRRPLPVVAVLEERILFATGGPEVELEVEA